jgi:hypothetical protein
VPLDGTNTSCWDWGVSLWQRLMPCSIGLLRILFSTKQSTMMFAGLYQGGFHTVSFTESSRATSWYLRLSIFIAMKAPGKIGTRVGSTVEPAASGETSRLVKAV